MLGFFEKNYVQYTPYFTKMVVLFFYFCAKIRVLSFLPD